MLFKLLYNIQLKYFKTLKTIATLIVTIKYILRVNSTHKKYNYCIVYSTNSIHILF